MGIFTKNMCMYKNVYVLILTTKAMVCVGNV